LIIPKGTRFQSECGNKCRAECAKVIEIRDEHGKLHEMGISKRDPSFIYTVGEMVREPDYDSNLMECSKGIHFFMREEDALAY
jgi:hypothetical protein